MVEKPEEKKKMKKKKNRPTWIWQWDQQNSGSDLQNLHCSLEQHNALQKDAETHSTSCS